ncbi:MAG: 6-carboxytetrahydropterin synthase [Myxococcales bacterium]|nr:6-carboxytetrahydropterin synthase [Myxococcales bacterium]
MLEPMLELTRRYSLPAAHVLANPLLTELENDKLFGKCANENGHGHNYEFEVTITGPVDAMTGQILAPERFDSIFAETIVDRYSHKLLNQCESFDALVPTTENFAEIVYQDLAPAFARCGSVRLVRVRLTETPRNIFEFGDPR